MKNLFRKAKTNFGNLFDQLQDDDRLGDPLYIEMTEIPSLVKELEMDRHTIEKMVMNDAVDMSKKNRPKENGDALQPYLKPHASAVSEICEKVHARLQCSGLARYKRQVMLLMEEKLAFLQKKESELRNGIRATERKVRDLESRHTFSALQAMIAMFVSSFFLGVDAAYNSYSLQVFNLSEIESGCFSTVLVLGLAIMGYEIIMESKKDETQKKSMLKIVLLSIVTILCFVMLSVMRIHYLTEFGGRYNLSGYYSLPIFFIINIVIFGGTSWLIHKFFPTRQQLKIYHSLWKEKINLLEMKMNLDGIITDIQSLKAEASKRVQRTDDLMDYGDDLIRGLLSFYETIIGRWIKEVGILLPYTPDCLDQEIPPVKYRFVKRTEDATTDDVKPDDTQSNSSPFKNFDYA